jgi:hypothetical protein
MSVGTTLVDVCSYAAAGLLAASKLLTAVQPLWAKLPKWLAVALPVVVLDIPQVAAAVGGVTTGTDLVTAVVTSVALLLPGLEAAEASSGS